MWSMLNTKNKIRNTYVPGELNWLDDKQTMTEYKSV